MRIHRFSWCEPPATPAAFEPPVDGIADPAGGAGA
jgi:hypothetical protein